MTNELHRETEDEAVSVPREWGMHNGLVVLAAIGLVALSFVLDWLRPGGLLAGAPIWLDGIINQLGFALRLAAGTVIGMLVATRMLQTHVSPRGARSLALWGIAAMILSALLQSGLYLGNFLLQEAGLPLMFAVLSISELVTGTMAIGAAMVALAFVGRLRH